MLLQALCIIFCHRSIQTWVTVRKRQIRVKISDFVPCDLEIWRMTLKNNRAPLLCYFKLWASFHSHRSIQSGVTVRKLPIWVKIGDFLSRVTLKLDGWPWKTIGHLSYATWSFMQHFITICIFKLELQSENCLVGFWPGAVTLTFDLWPWPLYGHHFCHW